MTVSQVLANQAAAAKAKAMAAKASIEQKKRQLEEQKKKAIATAKKMRDAKLKVARQQMESIKKTINDLESNVDIDVSGMMSYGAPRRRTSSRKRSARSGPRRKRPDPTLKQLQTLARRNKVSIYKMRKDRRGYTKMPLTKKALKARLSRARVSYKNLKAPRPRTRPRKSYVSSSPVLDPRRGCPAGKYKDPSSGICKTIPKYEDLDELDSVNFDWSSDRTFSNRPLSKQMYGRSCFGDIPPCDCGL